MTSVFPANLPTPDMVEAAVASAIAAHGYADDDGKTDRRLIRERMLEKLTANLVTSKRDVQNKAVTLTELMGHVFPQLASPGSFDEQDNPVLARDVWQVLARRLWTETRMNASGPLQKELPDRLGNGHWLIRRKETAEIPRAVYITDNQALINENFIELRYQAARKLLETATRDLEELARRQPGNALKYARNYKAQMTLAMESSVERVMLAASTAAADARPAPDVPDDAPEADQS